jgi:integrase
MISPEPTRILKVGGVVELKRLEAAVLEREITHELDLSMDEINISLNKLVEVDRISIERKGDLMKVRFKKLALPRSTENTGNDELKDVSDYWVDDFKTDYLQYVDTNLSPKSLDNAKRVMKSFCKFIGKKKLYQLQSSDAEDFKQLRKNQNTHPSDATINMDIRTLKSALQFAVDSGKLRENPFRSVKQIRCPRKQMPNFSHAEFNHLTAHIKEPWLLDIVRFDVNTGLRRGEIMDLKWKDVDLANKRMLIQSSEAYHVKHGKIRKVPLNKLAFEIVNKQKKTSEWVFSDADGQRFGDEYVSKTFKAYVRVCKLSEELHFHSLRATFATWAIAAGMSIYAVKAILGHASVKTTEPYASYEMDALQKEVEKIVLLEEKEEEKFKAPLKLVSKKGS